MPAAFSLTSILFSSIKYSAIALRPSRRLYSAAYARHPDPGVLLVVPLLDDACRAADGDAVRRDVMGDGTVRTDDGARADGDAWEHCDELADPDAVADIDALPIREAAGGRCLVGAAWMLAVVHAVVVIRDVDLAPHEHVVADLDAVHATDMHELADAHAVTDDELRLQVLRLRARAVAVDALQPHMRAKAAVCTNVHIFLPIDPGVERYHHTMSEKVHAIELLPDIMRKGTPPPPKIMPHTPHRILCPKICYDI